MAMWKRLLGSLVVSGCLGVFAAGGAAAATFTVGNDTGCTHGTVQGAINALPAGGTHEIRIQTGGYAAQAIKVSARVLTLRGGYPDCGAATATGSSTLSGQGGTRDSVITISGSGNDITLERLLITRGDETAGAHGGGIDFSGAGKLATRDVAITDNYAGYGGGINFNGSSGPSELIIGEDTSIMFNTAQYSGGGIRVEGDAVLQMTADRAWISGNEALGINPANSAVEGGYGGGVQVVNRARARIASPGLGAAAAITDNHARHGGGVAVLGEDRHTMLDLYSIDPHRPVRIVGNTASGTGGGIYLRSSEATLDNGLARGWLCGWDFGINENVAQNGSAIYAEPWRGLVFATGAVVQLNVADGPCGGRPDGAVSCATGQGCNTMSGNRAETSGGTPTDGATLLLQDQTIFEGNRVTLQGNKGGNVLRSFPRSGDANALYNALFADNQTSASLVRNSGPGTLKIENSTFAGNAIGGSHVLESAAAFVLHRSIVWQPGKPVLSQSGGSLSVGDLLVHDASGIGGVAPTVIAGDPLFLDPAKGDYRPHAASPAVDFSSSGGGLDLAGNTRGFDLPLVPDRFGTGDLGAYERVDVTPLVRNGDFNGSLRFWSGGSAISYDASQNPSGPSGSGVLKISGPVASGGRISSTQCVRIPGPGSYQLDALGRTAGAIVAGVDRALVGWSLIRSDPAGDCSGAVLRFGEHFAGWGNAWSAMVPVVIDVAEAEWTRSTSLAVHLIAQDGAAPGVGNPTANAWFDGIRLAPLGDDVIFADGFDD
ncbi:MAG: hypothetical protein J0H15_05205 [Xanthomonadales bacterium]|nr:hypothetical protein [Xanthomonadales bacterium]